jgi:hypothetical protein
MYLFRSDVNWGNDSHSIFSSGGTALVIHANADKTQWIKPSMAERSLLRMLYSRRDPFLENLPFDNTRRRDVTVRCGRDLVDREHVCWIH